MGTVDMASEMARALLLAIDPSTALDLPQPHAGQQRVMADAARFNVVAAGRRWGKNVLAEILVTEALVAGKRVAWFSPNVQDAARGLACVRGHCRASTPGGCQAAHR